MDNTPTTGLDSRFAQELGLQLRALRERRRETVEDVGRRLLMSANQIRALEEGEGEPFYGPRYHLQAARKYAAMSGLDFDALEAEFAPMGAQMALDDDGEPQSGLPFVAGESRTAAGAGKERPAARAGLTGASRKLALGGVAALAVAVIAVVAVRLLPDGKSNQPGKVTAEVPVQPQDASTPASATPQPSEVGSAAVTTPAAPAQASATGTVSAPAASPAPAPVSAAASAPVSSAAPAAPAASPSSASTPAAVATDTPVRKPKSPDAPAKAAGPAPGEMRITFSGSGWMQVVKRDGSRQVRNFRAKQSVTIQRKDLQALVISDWRKATVVSEGQKIDLSRHRPAGTNQAKLTGAKLRALGE